MTHSATAIAQNVSPARGNAYKHALSTIDVFGIWVDDLFVLSRAGETRDFRASPSLQLFMTSETDSAHSVLASISTFHRHQSFNTESHLMFNLAKSLLNDERGLVFTAELTLIATLSICCAAVGFQAASEAITSKLNTFASQMNGLDQQLHLQNNGSTQNALPDIACQGNAQPAGSHHSLLQTIASQSPTAVRR